MHVSHLICLNLPPYQFILLLVGMTFTLLSWALNTSFASPVGQCGTSFSCFVEKTLLLIAEPWVRSWLTRPKRVWRFGSWCGQKRHQLTWLVHPHLSWVPMTLILTTTSKILVLIAVWPQGKNHKKLYRYNLPSSKLFQGIEGFQRINGHSTKSVCICILHSPPKDYHLRYSRLLSSLCWWPWLTNGSIRHTQLWTFQDSIEWTSRRL